MRGRLRKKGAVPSIPKSEEEKKHAAKRKKKSFERKKKRKILPGVHFTSADRKTKSFKKETYFPNERFLSFKTFSID